jgi:hypothetical protein
MARRIFAIANATDKPATLASTYSQDNCPLPALQNTHTGGSGGDYIFLPDCSDSNFWADHHVSVTANDGSWAVSFWANDQNSRTLQWSPTNAYADGYNVDGSADYDDAVLLIETSTDGVHPTVHGQRWD